MGEQAVEPTMDQAMQDALQSVLNRVKDPESGLPIARLGVVERFRYNADRNELVVFTEFGSHMPTCITCVGIATIVVDGIQRRLREELERTFPGMTITLV